jgi:hypothetical protein
MPEHRYDRCQVCGEPMEDDDHCLQVLLPPGRSDEQISEAVRRANEPRELSRDEEDLAVLVTVAGSGSYLDPEKRVTAGLALLNLRAVIVELHKKCWDGGPNVYYPEGWL